MRSKLGFMFGTTAAIFTVGASSAAADVMPGFPSPAAAETVPLFFASLVFVLVVSGVSFLLLRKMVRARDTEEEDGGDAMESTADDAGRPSEGSEPHHAN
ncbi:MAG: hypothetical protein U1E22_04910 [Coriobacteriia bacterium]|nr:hypothetical protein [Coriobacteriia bacterium]